MTRAIHRCAAVLAIVLGSSLAFTQDSAVSPDGTADSTASDLKQSGLSGRPAWHEMITNIPGDWMRFGRETFRLEAIPSIAGTVVATGLFLALDQNSYEGTHDALTSSRFVRSCADVIVFAGDGGFSLGLAGAFALHGFAWNDDRSLRTASETVEALIASGIVVQILKRATGRESPQVATAPRGVWRPFPSFKGYSAHQPRYYAFPSGHITTAMATVTVISENYPELTWVRPAGYAVVALLGVSLVGKGWHWYSDLPLGIALGYAFGMIAAHRDEPSSCGSSGQSVSGFRFVPLISNRGAGAAIVYML